MGGLSSFRVSNFLSFQVSELQSFQVSKFPNWRYGGRGTNERPGNWSCYLRANERPWKQLHQMAHTKQQTNRRTWQFYIWISLVHSDKNLAIHIGVVVTTFLWQLITNGFKKVNLLFCNFKYVKTSIFFFGKKLEFPYIIWLKIF